MLDWRALAAVLCTVLATASVAWWLGTAAPTPAATTADTSPRIVSLSPTITETLFAIGASNEVVRRTDYCNFPSEASSLPSVGPGLSPDIEAIARAQPTLILGEATSAVDKHSLQAIAATELLPWLTLDDLRTSIPRLGALTNRPEEAATLLKQIEEGLGAVPPIAAPRVVVLLGIDGDNEDLWFVKPNSLHGLAISAAGAHNAVDTPISGAPSMSIERLIELDPDILIGMTANSAPSDASIQSFKQRFERLSTLKASQNGHITVIAGPELYSTGPLLLHLVQRLREAIEMVQANGAP